jgi:F-type H+-transporting ATPase subunit a
MPEQLWITALLNKYLAGVANGIMGVFHFHSSHPQAPITNYVAMQLVVFSAAGAHLHVLDFV